MRIKFKTDNAAFEDEMLRKESARILRVIADRIELGRDYGPCIDSNGNVVGEWSL